MLGYLYPNGIMAMLINIADLYFIHKDDVNLCYAWIMVFMQDST